MNIKKYEALDIETIWDNDVAKPICIAITNNNKINFKIIDVDKVDGCEILDFLLEKCHNNKVYYVHNLTFEIFVFLKYMKEKKIKFKIISSNKTVYSATIWYKKKKIELKCSYRLTLLPLRKLAELAELEEKGIFPYKILTKTLKDKMKIEKSMFENEKEFTAFTEIYKKTPSIFLILEKYCKNDALITKMSIIKFWKIIEDGGLENNGKILTAAKLSINNFFSKTRLVQKKIELKYDRLLRPYYFGGRTEVFGNLYENEIALHYDWSGMYAQCMKEKILGGEILECEKITNLDIPGFYWIKFEQNLQFPILPIKKKKLLFANGKFEGWYWFEEILLAIEYGVKIEKIEKRLSAKYFDYFIKEFIEINDNIRKISPLHKLIGKNNNNTFYGRLGMDPELLSEEIISNPKDFKDKYERIVEINGISLCQKKTEKSVSNLTISSAITAKARIKLYKGMMGVIREGGRLLYTDTDSIIAAFDKKEIDKKINKKIGEVYFDSKKEDTIIIDSVFAMPKTYAVKFNNGKTLVKIKGFNVKPNFEEFKEKFYNKKSIITENNEWNKKDLIIKHIKRNKRTDLSSLDKRKWSIDMKTTNPIKIIK